MLFYDYTYIWFLLILVPFMLFSAWASAKVNSNYSKFDRVPNSSRMTGYDTAVRLMQRNGVHDISVNRVRGRLSDHYHPTKKQVNLSESTYGSASVAAVAVAAHEIGHVMQKKEGYLPYKIRTVLVPAANIGSRLAVPFILIGIILDLIFYSTPTYIGLWFMYAGIIFYGLSMLFILVTLPVEFDASRRAKKMLVSEGILTQNELIGAKKVLSAAAMTYVASMLISLVYFLRYLFIVLSYAGRRR